MVQHQGWVALDIDGTITDQLHHVPAEVCKYLKSLYANAWQIVFITGRPLSFGLGLLQVFDFPFFLAVQNGADILQMPSQTLVSRCYLPGDMVSSLEGIYMGEDEDFVIYAGYEKGDFCYYRPRRFSPELMVHLEKIKALSAEPWKAVEAFNFVKTDTFPLIKCLGSEAVMSAMNSRLKGMKGICATLIRDPLAEGIYLNLVTSSEANKGSALERVIKEFGKRGRVIAAGDDRNDISMLEVADVSIVMETAPLEMHADADIIAKSATEYGIIDALEEATHAR